MMYPISFKKLVEDFKKLPGIGEKTAERMAFSILMLDDDSVTNFSTDIKNVKIKIKKCEICGTLCEDEKCMICMSKDRSSNTICVVEDSKDVFLFEKLGNYQGRYHVLGGLISPIDGIGPEDIAIKKLIERINKEKVEEIIVAVKGTIEGETTALYIKKLLEDTAVKVSRIASGIPVGAEIDYIDSLTLESALRNRKEIE
ncbi:MAG TPA: recombination mediator RecR [Bacilli bacterium]|nr:recombination mediator RecR [Bacilli bacterium]